MVKIRDIDDATWDKLVHLYKDRTGKTGRPPRIYQGYNGDIITLYCIMDILGLSYTGAQNRCGKFENNPNYDIDEAFRPSSKSAMRPKHPAKATVEAKKGKKEVEDLRASWKAKQNLLREQNRKKNEEYYVALMASTRNSTTTSIGSDHIVRR